MADGRNAPHANFVRPDLGSFCRLDELGLQVVGQRIELGRAVLACRVVVERAKLDRAGPLRCDERGERGAACH
jgi:hypothetical protein